MQQENHSDSNQNNSRVEIGYTSPNESETINLFELCQEMESIASSDLLDHQKQMSQMFENSIAANPDTIKVLFKTYKLVERAFLTAALYQDTTRRIYNELALPIKNH